jgi:hypothetical protein
MSTCSDDERKNRKRTRRNAIRPNSNEAEQLKEFAVTYQMNTIQIDMAPSSPESQIGEHDRIQSSITGERRNLGSSSAESDFADTVVASPPKKSRSNKTRASGHSSSDVNELTVSGEETFQLGSEQLASNEQKEQVAASDDSFLNENLCSSTSQPKI